MTEIEAIKDVKIAFDTKDIGYGCISKDTETTIISHNRLIPKKPTKDKYVPELDFCSECGTEVTNCNYCPHCGQKLDWSEKE